MEFLDKLGLVGQLVGILALGLIAIIIIMSFRVSEECIVALVTFIL